MLKTAAGAAGSGEHLLPELEFEASGPGPSGPRCTRWSRTAANDSCMQPGRKCLESHAVSVSCCRVCLTVAGSDRHDRNSASDCIRVVKSTGWRSLRQPACRGWLWTGLATVRAQILGGTKRLETPLERLPPFLLAFALAFPRGCSSLLHDEVCIAHCSLGWEMLLDVYLGRDVSRVSLGRSPFNPGPDRRRFFFATMEP